MQYLIAEYVGPKPQEVDNVANTGLVWVGKGARHEVPASAWEIMKRHPDVWALVVPAPARAGLAEADTPELIALRAENAKLKADLQTLREHIESLPKDDAAAQNERPADWLTMKPTELHAYAKSIGKQIDGRLKSADAIRAAIEA